MSGNYRSSASRCGLVAIALMLAAGVVFAQPYPARPVRIVVPGVSMGLTDISARLVALKMTETLGEQVAVENRVEAGGTAGTAAVARAAPDGYTLLAVDDSHAVNAHLFRNLQYDAIADFTPVSLLVRMPLVLVVNSHVPARTVTELLQLAKSKPGLVTFATTGPAAPARLMMEMLKLDARVNVTDAPYQDEEEEALAGVAGGRADAIFTTVSSAARYVENGRVRALAVTSEAPSAALPGVPLMKEAYPDFVAYFWVGLVAPAKTSASIVARLNADVVKVLRSEELRSRFGDLGLETVGSTPEEFDLWLKREVERWGRVFAVRK